MNKLASNISLGRNGAGVHWRSDYYRRGLGAAGGGYDPQGSYATYEDYRADTVTDLGGVALGEQVAIALLQEQAITYNEERMVGIPPAPVGFDEFFFTFLDFRNRRIRITGLGNLELA